MYRQRGEAAKEPGAKTAMMPQITCRRRARLHLEEMGLENPRVEATEDRKPEMKI